VPSNAASRSRRRCLAESEFIKQAALAHQLIVTCAPRLAQLMAIEILQRPEMLKAHVPFYEKARERLQLVARELPSDAPMFLGNGAFYAILDVSQYGKDSMALALALLEQQDVVVVPGIAFGPSGDWFWRISYAGGAEAAGEGMARIARFLADTDRG
jgi:aminotransferase